MKLTHLIAAVAVVAAVGVAASMALTQADAAPQVQYTLLDGSARSSEALKGKVVLVNFWATSCTTCMKEMPMLVSTHQKYAPQGYETLSVAMAYDPRDFVDNYAKSRQLPFQVTHDATGTLAKQFGQVQITPTSFLINRKGEIVKRYVGEPDHADFHQLIERLLAEGQPKV